MPDSPEVLERFHANLDLAESVASDVSRKIEHRLEWRELLSFGQEGLLDAARRFDPARGVPFRAYAVYRVRGAIIDGIRAACWLPRHVYERLRALEAAYRVSEGQTEDLLGSALGDESIGAAEAALTDHLGGMAMAMALGLMVRNPSGDVDSARSPESAVARVEALTRIDEALARLDHQEAEIVRRHYFDDEPFERVARTLGLSKSWVSRLHTKAMIRLASWFKPTHR